MEMRLVTPKKIHDMISYFAFYEYIAVKKRVFGKYFYVKLQDNKMIHVRK